MWFLATLASLALLPSTGIAFDSVSPRRGDVRIAQADIALPTPLGPLRVTRHFQVGTQGALGSGWSLDIEQRLVSIGTDAVVIGAVGSEQTFFRQGPTFVGPEGARAEARADGWRVNWPRGSTSTFDASGREVERRDLNGNTITFALDAQRRLLRIDGGAGHALALRYDERGLLRGIDSTAGEKASYTYDGTGRLVQAVDAVGGRSVYQYTNAGTISDIAYPDGRRAAYSYDATGRVRERRASNGPSVRYDYSERSTRIAHGTGLQSELTYDVRGLPAAYRDNAGARRTWNWDERGRLVSETFSDGSSLAYSYDGQGRVIAQQSSRGDQLRIAHTSDSGLVSALDLNGAVTRFEYDAKGRLVAHTSPAGRRTLLDYDERGRIASVTDGRGHVTRFEYDRVGQTVRRVRPDGNATTWSYDPRGRTIAERGPNGATIRYAYDAAGALNSITEPSGRATGLRYDDRGRIAVIESSGEAMDLVYDDANRLVQVRHPDGTSEGTQYDASGNPVEFVDRIGRVTRFEYDAAGQLQTAVVPGEVRIAVRRDAAGQPLAVASPTQEFALSADSGSRRIRLRDATGTETEMQADSFGRIARILFPNGGEERRHYDPDGLLARVTLASGDTWSFTHDGAGQLREVVFPAGQRGTITRDAAGLTSQVTRSFAQPVQYRHDGQGQILEQINGRGQRVQYAYDPSGRLSAKTTPSSSWRFRYDDRGNLLEASDGSYVVRHAYDAAGRRASTQYPIWGKTIAYRYDPFGRMDVRIDPDGGATRYGYDELGRLARLEWLGEAFRYSYDVDGRLVKADNPNGTVSEYSYDAVGRLTRVAHVDAGGHPIAAHTYAYDAEANRTLVNDEAGRSRAYRYDLDRRMVEEAGPDGRVRITYGPGGDRLSVANAEGNTVYRYDATGRLEGVGATEFAYDADGNLVLRKDQSGTSRYEYDAEGRLTKVSMPGDRIVRFSYGPFGERIWREEDGKRAYFLYDGEDVLQELDASFRTRVTYVHAGLDRPLARAVGGRKEYIHLDGSGTVVALSDTQGRTLARPLFDAFGNRRNAEGTELGLGMAARPLDPVTGLYDMRARAYDPTTGRFLSPDPLPGSIADPVSLAPYLYARANPLSFDDPLGLAWEVIRGPNGTVQAINFVSQQGNAYPFPRMMGQPAPMFLRPLAIDLMGATLTSRDLASLAEGHAYLLRPDANGRPTWPGEAAAYRRMAQQMLLDKLARPTAPPGPLSRAASYVGGLLSNALGTVQRGAMRCYGAICPPGPTVAQAGTEVGGGSGASTTQVAAGAAATEAAAAGGASLLSAASIRAAGPAATAGYVSMLAADMVGEISSGDDAGSVIRSRFEGVTGRSVLVAGGVGLGLTTAAILSPAVATGLAAVAVGATAMGAASRVGNAASEYVGGLGAYYDELRSTLSQWDMEGRLQEARTGRATRIDSSTGPDWNSAAPVPSVTPTPLPMTSPSGQGATAGACPPGTVPAKDGSCVPETSSEAALDAYSRAAQQQMQQQQVPVPPLPGDRRPGRVGPGDTPPPPIGGGGATTPQDPGSRKPPQEPARAGCKSNAECGLNAYCDPGSGRCIGCPTGQRANPDGSPGCIPIPAPQPVKPVKPQTPEPPGPAETKAWYGVEVYYSYKRGGTPCTIGAHKEVFGTRADANEALRFEAWNLGTILSGTDRTDVRIIRQGIYAGPQSTKPTYTGDTRANCQ